MVMRTARHMDVDAIVRVAKSMQGRTMGVRDIFKAAHNRSPGPVEATATKLLLSDLGYRQTRAEKGRIKYIL